MVQLAKKDILFLLLLLLVAFVARAVFIEADAPLSLTWSYSAFSDAGARSLEARNLALFGEAFPVEGEEVPTAFVSPAMTGFLHLDYSLFGVGYAQLRMLSVLFSVLSIALLYMLARGFAGRRVAWLSALFLALSYPAVMFDRIGFLETYVVFFFLLSLFLWAKGNESRNAFAFRLVSVACLSTAFLFKPTALVFIPVLAVAFFLSRESAAKKPGFLQGLALAIAFFGFLAVVSFLDPRFFDLSGDSVPAHVGFSLLEAVRNFALFFANRLFSQAIVLAALSAFAMLFALWQFISKRFASGGRVLMAAWLLFASAGLALLSYQPPRYFVLLLPPLCFLAADFLIRFCSPKRIFFPNLSKAGLAGFVVWLAVAVFAFSIWANKFLFEAEGLNAMILNIFVSASAFFAAGLLVLVFGSWKKLSFSLGKNIGRAVFLAVLVLFLASNIVPYIAWASSPQYTLVNASRQLGFDLPAGGLVTGFSAGHLCMEISQKCVFLFFNFNNVQPFERFKPTHLLLDEGLDDGILDEAYPEGWRHRLEFVKSYLVGGEEVGLYRVKG